MCTVCCVCANHECAFKDGINSLIWKHMCVARLSTGKPIPTVACCSIATWRCVHSRCGCQCVCKCPYLLSMVLSTHSVTLPGLIASYSSLAQGRWRLGG